MDEWCSVPEDRSEYDDPAYRDSHEFEHCNRCPYYDCCDDAPLTEDECDRREMYLVNDAKLHNN